MFSRLRSPRLIIQDNDALAERSIGRPLHGLHLTLKRPLGVLKNGVIAPFDRVILARFGSPRSSVSPGSHLEQSEIDRFLYHFSKSDSDFCRYVQDRISTTLHP